MEASVTIIAGLALLGVLPAQRKDDPAEVLFEAAAEGSPRGDLEAAIGSTRNPGRHEKQPPVAARALIRMGFAMRSSAPAKRVKHTGG